MFNILIEIAHQNRVLTCLLVHIKFNTNSFLHYNFPDAMLLLALGSVSFIPEHSIIIATSTTQFRLLDGGLLRKISGILPLHHRQNHLSVHLQYNYIAKFKIHFHSTVSYSYSKSLCF